MLFLLSPSNPCYSQSRFPPIFPNLYPIPLYLLLSSKGSLQFSTFSLYYLHPEHHSRFTSSTRSSHTKPSARHNELGHACHLKTKRFLVVKPRGERCDTGMGQRRCRRAPTHMPISVPLALTLRLARPSLPLLDVSLLLRWRSMRL